MQVGLGYSPLEAGLAGIGQAAGMVAGFVVSQPAIAKLGGRRVMHAGEALTAAGFAAFVAVLQLAGDSVGIAAMTARGWWPA